MRVEKRRTPFFRSLKESSGSHIFFSSALFSFSLLFHSLNILKVTEGQSQYFANNRQIYDSKWNTDVNRIVWISLFIFYHRFCTSIHTLFTTRKIVSRLEKTSGITESQFRAAMTLFCDRSASIVATHTHLRDPIYRAGLWLFRKRYDMIELFRLIRDHRANNLDLADSFESSNTCTWGSFLPSSEEFRGLFSFVYIFFTIDRVTPAPRTRDELVTLPFFGRINTHTAATHYDVKKNNSFSLDRFVIILRIFEICNKMWLKKKNR